jgi:hypothetical protein
MTVELTVLCEGQTEVNFVQQVLSPHLSVFGVYPKAIPLAREAFGTVPFAKLRNASKQEIGRARSHQFTTTMVDLYALHGFPEQDAKPGEAPSVRACRIEAAMADDLPSSRFLPYIQVHELEALVFVDLNQLRPSFPDHDLTVPLGRLQTDVAGLAPEDIDDGAETAPSKRLIKYVAPYKHAKAYAGPQAAARIGLARLRGACPHFAAWLSRLEGLCGS